MEHAIRKTAQGYDIDVLNFGTIALSEFKMKYDSSAEVPTHLLSFTNHITGLIGHLAVRSKIRPDERQYDLNAVSSLVDKYLSRTLNSMFGASDWTIGDTAFRQNRREKLIETNRFRTQSTMADYIIFRTQPNMAGYVAVCLSDSVYFSTELEPGSNDHPDQAKYCGTCKVFGYQTRFSLHTPVVPLEWLNLDNMIQEVKDLLTAQFGTDGILSEVCFNDTLPKQDFIPVCLTFPATPQ